MILSFTDLHLGLKHQSKQEAFGLYTSELEAYKCLDYIYDYCVDTNNKIDLVIFKGDWFHTNTPSGIHYTRTINWLTKFNDLGIMFKLIPGNHSCTVFSNCLTFIKELQLDNVEVFDSLDELNHMKYGEYNIYFVPYKYSESMKERAINVESSFKATIEKITTKKNIIVSHLQEVSAKIGSESLMIAKGVELVDISEIGNVDLILLGHIHRQQMYHKNGVPIVYAGSPYYQDKSDVNQQKGFCVIDGPDNVTYVNIPTIRKYHKVSVNQAILNNLNALFQNRRFVKNDVLYFDCNELERDISIEEELQSKCVEFTYVYGGTSYQKDDSGLEMVSVELDEDDNPQTIFKDWVNGQEGDKEFLDAVYNKGTEYLDSYYKV
jgi:DNA repair exonuclease SbcCD nuclease subunit